MSEEFSIGGAAKRSGVKVPTIRYYEEIGLLSPLGRTDSNRRVYSPRDIERLGFIRHARELGFEIEAIRTLVTLQDQPDQPCSTADVVARRHLADVERRIASLTALRDELVQMIEGCDHGRVNECRVIQVLADHGQCVHEHDKPATTLQLA